MGKKLLAVISILVLMLSTFLPSATVLAAEEQSTTFPISMPDLSGYQILGGEVSLRSDEIWEHNLYLDRDQENNWVVNYSEANNNLAEHTDQTFHVFVSIELIDGDQNHVSFFDHREVSGQEMMEGLDLSDSNIKKYEYSTDAEYTDSSLTYEYQTEYDEEVHNFYVFGPYFLANEVPSSLRVSGNSENEYFAFEKSLPEQDAVIDVSEDFQMGHKISLSNSSNYSATIDRIEFVDGYSHMSFMGQQSAVEEVMVSDASNIRTHLSVNGENETYELETEPIEVTEDTALTFTGEVDSEKLDSYSYYEQGETINGTLLFESGDFHLTGSNAPEELGNGLNLSFWDGTKKIAETYVGYDLDHFSFQGISELAYGTYQLKYEGSLFDKDITNSLPLDHSPRNDYREPDLKPTNVIPVDGFEVHEYLDGELSRIKDNGDVDYSKWVKEDLTLSTYDNYLEDSEEYQLELSYVVENNDEYLIYHHVQRLTGQQFKQLSQIQMNDSFQRFELSKPEGYSVHRFMAVPELNGSTFTLNSYAKLNTFLLDSSVTNPNFKLQGYTGGDNFYAVAEDHDPSIQEVSFSEEKENMVPVTVTSASPIDSLYIFDDVGSLASHIDVINQPLILHLQKNRLVEANILTQSGQWEYGFSRDMNPTGQTEFTLDDINATSEITHNNYWVEANISYNGFALNRVSSTNHFADDQPIQIMLKDEEGNVVLQEQKQHFSMDLPETLEAGNYTVVFEYPHPFEDKTEAFMKDLVIEGEENNDEVEVPNLEVFKVTTENDGALLSIDQTINFSLEAAKHDTFIGRAEVHYVDTSDENKVLPLTLENGDISYNGSFKVAEGMKQVQYIEAWIVDQSDNKSSKATLKLNKEVASTLTGQVGFEDGTPLKGKVSVTLVNEHNYFTTTSSEDGQFTFDKIPAGSYSLSVSTNGMNIEDVASVELGQSVRKVLDSNVTIPYYQTIKVAIEADDDVDMKDVAGSSLALTHSDNRRLYGKINESGAFVSFSGEDTFELVPSGDYDVEFYGSDHYELSPTTVTIDNETDYLSNPLTLQLSGTTPETSQVTVNVKDAGGNPISNSYVQLYNWSVSQEVGKEYGYAMTNEDSSLGVSPKTGYTLEVSKNGYQSYRQTVDITSDRTIDVVLEEAVSVTGKVLSVDGVIDNARIYNQNGPEYTTSNADGSFEIEGVSKTDVALSIEMEGFQTQTVTPTSKDGSYEAVNVTLVRDGYVEGAVYLNSQEHPVAGGFVNLYDAEGTFIGSSRLSEDGQFKIYGVDNQSEQDYTAKISGWDIPYTTEKLSPTKTEQTIIIPMNVESDFTGEGNSFAATKSGAAPGEVFEYQVKYQNNGDAAKNDLPITFNLDENVEYVPNSALLNGTKASISLNGQELSIGAQDVKAGDHGTVRITVKIKDDATSTISTTASINDESAKVATTELLFVSLEAPEATSTKEVKVYGEAKPDTTVKVFAGDKELSTTTVDGRWWYADVELPVEDAIKTEDFSLVAQVTDGEDTHYSKAVQLSYKPDVPRVKGASITAGWNQNVPLNPYTGLVTTSIVEYTPIDIEVQLDKEVDKASIQFVGRDVTLTHQGSGKYTGKIDHTWSSFGEQVMYVTVENGEVKTKLPLMNVIVLIDPSGYVFEGSMDNRLEGVKAIVQEKVNGTWKDWDAENFGQVNPQVTDDEGRYGWDVPQGDWRVIFSKEGYETYVSRDVVVPPPETELNIPMVRTSTPKVSSVTPSHSSTDIAIGGELTVIFDRLMNQNNMESQIILKDESGNQVPVSFTFENISGAKQEDGYYVEDDTQKLSKSITVKPNQALSNDTTYTLAIAPSVQSYDGKALGTVHESTFTTKKKVSENGGNEQGNTGGSDNGSGYTPTPTPTPEPEEETGIVDLKQTEFNAADHFTSIDRSDVERWDVSDDSIADIQDDGTIEMKSDGLVVVEATTKTGDKVSKLLVLSEKEVKEWEQEETNEKGKTWTVTFNTTMNADLLNDKEVQIIDEEGNKVSVTLKLSEDGKQLMITPEEDYAAGGYNLYISHGLASGKGIEMDQSIFMNFKVR
ncbi:carboxypeptidase regulatory-like domain-containing protein [Halobacillus locisalis]|uniref:Carboxypeptidase regulatory-like domain-containing protein n=1 Tax=Halobacillus locisalis TaxID=220753 RepID=A0A838CTR5_9BACI|nr:carboxypeptidase regulatory-like domain-containing protein [Halobacillus locisalis]MBA2175321.1 carboxypeptidase regulatory-like domain-containing protein [Halobacillus locisalis]